MCSPPKSFLLPRHTERPQREPSVYIPVSTPQFFPSIWSHLSRQSPCPCLSLVFSHGGALEWGGLRIKRAGLGHWTVVESLAPGISILRSRDIRPLVPGLRVIFLGGSGECTEQTGGSQPQASRSSFGSGGGGPLHPTARHPPASWPRAVSVGYFYV